MFGSIGTAVQTASTTEQAGYLPPGISAQVLYTSDEELLVPCVDGNMLSILEVRWKAHAYAKPGYNL